MVPGWGPDHKANAEEEEKEEAGREEEVDKEGKVFQSSFF